jgi:hypothetical protein
VTGPQRPGRSRLGRQSRPVLGEGGGHLNAY